MLLLFAGVALAFLQTGDWTRFSAIVDPAVPREGRIQLLYEMVEPPGVFARELVGFNYDHGGFIRVQAGSALGVSSSGRQFAGRLGLGCSWLDAPDSYPPQQLNPSSLVPAPIEILRFVLERPDLVLNLRSTDGGGFVFDMDVLQGVPGVAEADIQESAVVKRERWSIEIGPDGRVLYRMAPTTIKYEYGTEHWPLAFEKTGPSGTRRYELVSVEVMAPNALTPEGAMAILSSVETQRIRKPSEMTDAAAGIGEVPDTYARDPSGRWAFALIVGGILILFVGGGVLARKRYAAA